jgi:hypothetical protein
MNNHTVETRPPPLSTTNSSTGIENAVPTINKEISQISFVNYQQSRTRKANTSTLDATKASRQKATQLPEAGN